MQGRAPPVRCSGTCPPAWCSPGCARQNGGLSFRSCPNRCGRSPPRLRPAPSARAAPSAMRRRCPAPAPFCPWGRASGASTSRKSPPRRCCRRRACRPPGARWCSRCRWPAPRRSAPRSRGSRPSCRGWSRSSHRSDRCARRRPARPAPPRTNRSCRRPDGRESAARSCGPACGQEVLRAFRSPRCSCPGSGIPR